ncbi:hypothetical protein ABW20_dc0101538 [Dactylellina cionopaga]|nr:hypothetical protein ABW20_dc0101538 [Dactylellina cionopaga]
MAKRRRLSESPAPCARSAEQPERAPKRRFFGKSHFLDLPQELILRVLHFLPVQTLLTVSRTSQKLHTLASDPQLWKTKFWTKFIHPRIQRRARLNLPDTFSEQDGTGPGFMNDWRLWLDDHVLIQEERELAVTVKPRDIASQYSPKTQKTALKQPTLDWKAKFRLRSNWQRGAACSSEINLLTSSPVSETSKASNVEKPKRLQVLGSFYQGYFISADSENGVRVFSCSNKSQVELIRRATSLGDPTCLRIDESLLNDTSGRRYKTKGIDFVVGYCNGTFAIFHFDPIACRLSEKYIKRSFDDDERAELAAFYLPYLAIITGLNQLSILSFHGPKVKSSSSGKPEAHPADRPLFPPKTVATFMINKAWFPTCLSFRKDPGSGDIISSVVFSIRSIVVGSSITVQEFRLSPNVPKLLETEVVSPPLHDALDQAFFGRTAHMAFTTPTCVSYRHPFILTSHADNTLVLYNLYTTECGKLEIQAGQQLWGHNTSVMAVEVGLRKAVSVDRRGEVRVWDLQARYERAFGRDRSTRVGGSGDPLFLNLDGKQGVQIERCSVGFGDEGIVVMEKVKDLDQSTTDIRLAVYNFT